MKYEIKLNVLSQRSKGLAVEVVGNNMSTKIRFTKLRKKGIFIKTSRTMYIYIYIYVYMYIYIYIHIQKIQLVLTQLMMMNQFVFLLPESNIAF